MRRSQQTPAGEARGKQTDGRSEGGGCGLKDDRDIVKVQEATGTGGGIGLETFARGSVSDDPLMLGYRGGPVPLCQQLRLQWAGLSLSILWCQECVLGAFVALWYATRSS